MDVPLSEFTEDQWAWLLEGKASKQAKGGWHGLRGWFKWLETKAYKMHVRVFLSRFRKYVDCPSCDAKRFRPDTLRWHLGEHTISSFYALSAAEAREFLDRQRARIAQDEPTLLLLDEAHRRLATLEAVGLGYLTLDRASRTLSGGEAQRVGLTSALSASLNGVMFVLDEPTVGLHPSDVDTLFGVVSGLAKGDNIAVVVEHDGDVISRADRVVELGPGAGEKGGNIVFDGTPKDLLRADTRTGRSLSSPVRPPKKRREPKGWIRLEGCTGNNLQDVDLELPVGVMTCITGVSGSGKSSLIVDTLYPAVARRLHKSAPKPLPFRKTDGLGVIADVIQVDQSPMGRTSRGNAATYMKIWDRIRERFVAEKLAKERGYTPGFFSLNVAGGRCETCKGQGAETVEMQFLADVSFSCPDCGGKRFVGEVLEVRHRGHNVADILELTVDGALELFADDKKVRERIEPLAAVGLGYLRL
ncbi:MAG: excinuclease ABC subunit A, partial [Myxococcales bacterium]|nr:excinuclease ABC subunit A [Myxococcales bacterium]